MNDKREVLYIRVKKQMKEEIKKMAYENEMSQNLVIEELLKNALKKGINNSKQD